MNLEVQYIAMWSVKTIKATLDCNMKDSRIVKIILGLDSEVLLSFLFH